MNLRHMEVFRAVMVAGSVRGAARALSVSEPAVSKLLGTAERRAGCRLFERVKGRLVATPEARLLHAEVERAWHGVERVMTLAGKLSQARIGSLVIATSPSLATALIPAAVARVLADAAEIDLKVDLLVPTLLHQAVVEGDADVGVALRCDPHPNIAVQATFACGLVCVVAPGHRLSLKRSVAAQDLEGERVISYPELADLVAGSLDGRAPDLVLRSAPAACWFAQAGVGVAIVDRAAVAGLQAVWKPLRAGGELQIAVVSNPLRPLSGIARTFIAALGDVAKGMLR